jgi:competence protein ComFC
MFSNERCYVCLSDVVSRITWETLLYTDQKQTICESCQSKLVQIEGETCFKCSRPLQKLAKEYINHGMCADCQRWDKNPEWKGVLDQNHSFYEYNDFLQELLAKFKYRGDYALAEIFSEKIRQFIKTVDYDVIIPIPLSEERLQERGFNQTEALLQAANLPYEVLLKRTHSEKQSKKTRQERLQNAAVFETTEILPEKKILLLDDIYTTGSTLHHAAKVLKLDGAEKVISITIARG